MAILNNNYGVNGNTVLVPNRRKEYDEEQARKLRKSKEEHIRRKALAKNKIKAKIMLAIVIGFFIGVSMIYRYSAIYTLGNKLQAAQLDAQNMQKNNENLELQLAKFNNLQNLQQKANALQMVQPDKNSAVYVDLNKQSVK